MNPPGFRFWCLLVLLKCMKNNRQSIYWTLLFLLYNYGTYIYVCVCMCWYVLKREKKNSLVQAKSQRTGVAGWYFTTIFSSLFIEREDKCAFCSSYLHRTVGSLGTTVSWLRLKQSPGHCNLYRTWIEQSGNAIYFLM